ncbi:methyl-accepting chemotaxis protein [Jiella sp. M17.18]|uniref:HAMP domain-containing methyl-accepting chemotaxis protein n=1 Tax=Jiella sp. M17.18 TaxID=3234247 RepID=UPI0034DF0620
MRWNDLATSRKLILAFVAVIATSLLANALLYGSLKAINRSSDGNDQSFELNLGLARMMQSVYQQQSAVRGYMLKPDDAYLQQYKDAKAAFDKEFQAFQQNTVSKEQKDRIVELKNQIENWQTNSADLRIQLAGDPATRELSAGMLGQVPLTDAQTILAAINKTERALIDERIAERRTASTSATLTLLAGGGLALLIAALMGFLLSRSIARPLMAMTAAMRRLADGDKTVSIPAMGRRDEVGRMAGAVETFKQAAIEKDRLEAEAEAARIDQEAAKSRQAALDNAKAEDLRAFVGLVEAGFDRLSGGDLTVRMSQTVAPEFEPIRAKFNDSVVKLENAIGQVVTATGQIRIGLSEINTASGDLAHRTEQQAASIEETVAALSEITSAVNETAAGAGRAQASASEARRDAEKGGTIVAEAVAAMGRIEKSSEEINQIISVIDEIAFQTNLLALNAGVEAARAGEAGKGFAVVAQEVRGLAQRSAEAAKEIKELISASRHEVATGVDRVTASGQSLQDIVARVGETAEIIARIAESTGEQATNLREVAAAADQMDKVTQQNAAMVEQATAASQTLSKETEELVELVAQFKTTGGSSEAEKPAARPVVQMKASGAWGAVRAAAVASDEETWAEF